MSQKTALVTGCSSGIGHCLALEFAKRGYIVFACARCAESMSDIVSIYPNQIIPFSMDVSSLESIETGYEFVSKKLEELGINGLDVVYNNAGSSCTFPGIDVPDAALVQCMETNFIGPIRIVHLFSRLVIAKEGTFAFTGSAAGYCPFPWGSVYGASKAAIGQYASILAFELEPFNVSVKNFITGGVKTNIADKRPLPEGSIYNIEPMRKAFEERQKFAERNNPMEPSIYASKAVDEIENGWRSKVDVYLGTWSILPRLVAIFPRSLILFIFRFKFHLRNVWKALSQNKDKKD
jgi:1-acylglycerone phosphate reductase